MEKIIIGKFVLKQADTFRNHFETASWYEDVQVYAGEYDLYIYKGESSREVYTKLEGVCIDAYFPSSFGGVSISNKRNDENVGQPSKSVQSWYGYNLAELVAKGDERFFLYDNCEIVVKQDVDYWGKPKLRYSLKVS